MSGLPADLDAERSTLGACMESLTNFKIAAGIVTERDWFDPRHAVVWQGIAELAADNCPADPKLLFDHMKERGMFRGSLDGNYLHTLQAEAPMVATVDRFARIVADMAVRRRVVQTAQRAIQRAEDRDGDVSDLLSKTAEDLAGARDERVGVELLTRPVAEFMRAATDQTDWVVPGLLARGDRLVLTGSGGLGKSTVLQQIAVCAAAGIDPFDWSAGEAYDPVKVSVLDCENADDQLRKRIRPMLDEATHAGQPVEDRLMIGGGGNPLDLLDTATAMSVMRTVEHDKPDLVYIGPAYKLHNDDPDKESVIKRVTKVLDQIRAMGAAVITEAHHTKAAKLGGSMEPSGSNLWTWWPEFGRGLRLDPDSDFVVRRCSLESWRIDRVSRNWPEWIEHGGRWPWARCADNPYYGGVV